MLDKMKTYIVYKDEHSIGSIFKLNRSTKKFGFLFGEIKIEIKSKFKKTELN